MIADLFPEKIAIQMMCNDIFKVLKKFPFKLEFYIQRKYISEVKENEMYKNYTYFHLIKTGMFLEFSALNITFFILPRSAENQISSYYSYKIY